MKKSAFIIIAVGLLAAIVAVALLLSREDFYVASNVSSPPEIDAGSKTLITLEEFGDYQSVPCAELYPSLKDLKKELGPRLNFIFRNFPISKLHKNGPPAAQAAEAARMQNRFWEMHDLLFERQAIWVESKTPKTEFLKFAADLGLDITRFENDMGGDQVRFKLEADHDAAVRLGIDSTPTILINGRKLRPEATNEEGVRKGIEVLSRPRPGSGSVATKPSVS